MRSVVDRNVVMLRMTIKFNMTADITNSETAPADWPVSVVTLHAVELQTSLTGGCHGSFACSKSTVRTPLTGQALCSAPPFLYLPQSKALESYKM